jgi:hypothetical protein
VARNHRVLQHGQVNNQQFPAHPNHLSRLSQPLHCQCSQRRSNLHCLSRPQISLLCQLSHHQQQNQAIIIISLISTHNNLGTNHLSASMGRGQATIIMQGMGTTAHTTCSTTHNSLGTNMPGTQRVAVSSNSINCRGMQVKQGTMGSGHTPNSNNSLP